MGLTGNSHRGKESEGSRVCLPCNASGWTRSGLAARESTSWNLFHHWAALSWRGGCSLPSPLPPLPITGARGLMGNTEGPSALPWKTTAALGWFPISKRQSLMHIILLQQVANSLFSIFRFPGNHTKEVARRFCHFDRFIQPQSRLIRALISVAQRKTGLSLLKTENNAFKGEICWTPF